MSDTRTAVMGFCRWQNKRSAAHHRANRHPISSRRWRAHTHAAGRYDARSFNIHRPRFLSLGAHLNHLLGFT